MGLNDLFQLKSNKGKKSSKKSLKIENKDKNSEI